MGFLDFYTTGMNQELALELFIIHTICAITFGFVVSFVYKFKNEYSKTMALTLVVLPTLVQAIIMLVSGSIGAGIAVAGAFSLVRFRSATGNAKDIGFLFFAMVLGFITGMGYLLFALVFLIIVSCVFLVMAQFSKKEDENLRKLRITIPESLDFDGVLDDVFANYAIKADLEKVKSTNMGSMYELTFTVVLKNSSNLKSFIDELRTRNGNLNIFISRITFDSYEL